jgi:hypothetical protein
VFQILSDSISSGIQSINAFDSASVELSKNFLEINKYLYNAVEDEDELTQTIKLDYDKLSFITAAGLSGGNTYYAKQYIETDASYAIRSLDSLTTTQNISIENLTDPTNNFDAVHKKYAEEQLKPNLSVAVANADTILISDFSDSGIMKKGPTFGTSTTTFLRNDGGFATPPYPVTSVNGLTGALNTESMVNAASSTINSISYGRVYGSAVIDSGGTKLRVETGFYEPSGSDTANSISFTEAFANEPMVIAFPIKAASTTTTVSASKIRTITTTGFTVINSFVTPTTSGYTPSTETHG